MYTNNFETLFGQVFCATKTQSKKTKRKQNYEREKQKKTQIENLMLKSEDFFGDNI